MAWGNNLRTCYLTHRDSQQHRGNTCCHWGLGGRLMVVVAVVGGRVVPVLEKGTTATGKPCSEGGQ